jgi:hypothetical protein
MEGYRRLKKKPENSGDIRNKYTLGKELARCGDTLGMGNH